MNIDTVKVELIDWIAQLKDEQTLQHLQALKNKEVLPQEGEPPSKIYGSGKHLIAHVAEDFNEPLDSFQAYQK